MEAIARILEIPLPGVWALLAVAGLIACVTVARSIGYQRRRKPQARKSLRRVVTWCALLVLLLGVLALGRGAMVFVMIGVSLLGLREALYLTAAPHLYLWGVALTIALYGWAWFDWSSLFLVALPLFAALLAIVEFARRGRQPVGSGLLLAVIGPSYTIAVASLPAHAAMPEGRFGWLVLLLLLTGLHDSAQAWWGRMVGSRQFAPRLSPAKTWAGLWGGLATTTFVTTLAGPALTPIGRGEISGSLSDIPTWLTAAAFGLAVALAGTAGDLAASALKRRAHVKDSGAVVPGHGGVLDRFDSLAATAPVFFFLALVIWFRP